MSSLKIQIKTAQELDESAKKAITKWFSSQTDQNVEINFRIDGTIMGGAIVQLASKLFDWSLRSGAELGKQSLIRVVSA